MNDTSEAKRAFVRSLKLECQLIGVQVDEIETSARRLAVDGVIGCQPALDEMRIAFVRLQTEIVIREARWR